MTDHRDIQGRRASRRRFLSWLGAGAAIPLVAACGESDEAANGSGGTSPTEPVASAGGEPTDAAAILEAAAVRIGEIESVRFELGIDGTTYIDEARTIQLLNAAGNLVRPDRVQATFQAQLNGQLNAEIRIITVGEQTWMTDIITGDWIPAFEEIGYDPTILFDDQDGLGPVMRAATDPTLVGEEEIDGNACHRIAATVTQEVIGPITANTMSSPIVAVDLWVDVDSADLRRAVVVEQPNPETTDPATWTLTISRQNEPVTIEPPI